MKSLSKKYMLLLVGALTLVQVGCKEALDLEPLDQLSDASYWKTPNDFMLAANQFYVYERTFADVIYDVVPNTTRQSYHSDAKSDLIVSATSTQNIYNQGLNTVQTTDANYTDAYSRIRTINYLLDKAQTYPNPTEIAKYVGEAKFFRAYVYFDLLQYYGGVPIINKLLAIDSPELQAPRNSRDEVVDFIVQDLTEALAGVLS
jgi:hypothetical protein